MDPHILGRPLDRPESLPFFDLMAQLDCPLWLHPDRGYEKRLIFHIFKSRLPAQITLSGEDDFGKGIRTPGAAENDLFNPGGNGFQ